MGFPSFPLNENNSSEVISFILSPVENIGLKLKGQGNDARFVIRLCLTPKKFLMELTFIVVEARIEACLSTLDIRASFCASFPLRYQRRHP